MVVSVMALSGFCSCGITAFWWHVMNISPRVKALLVGVSGTVFQWYDFALFGYLAPIIAATYFPNDSHYAALLNTFGIFAVGYLLAPLGSVVFGYIGDQYGRKRALTLSILGMAIPTAMISIVPGYNYIGIAAPILITLLRVIQGFVASSEIVGSTIFLVEHARPAHKALYGCLSSSAYSIGLVLAGLTASFLTASFMPEWAWRAGFATAIIAGLLIFLLRKHIAETPDFTQIKDHEKPCLPIMSAIREMPLAMVGVIGIAWLVGIMTFGTYVFVASYLHTYCQVSTGMATFIVTVSLIVDAILEPFVAILADKTSYLWVSSIGMTGMMLSSIPVFHLLSSGNVVSMTTGLVLLSVCIAITYAPLNAYMVSLFPRQYRYSGFGVAFNIGISIFGGTTPLVMMWLVEKTGSLIAPAWYYVFGTIIGLISLAICQMSCQPQQSEAVYLT